MRTIFYISTFIFSLTISKAQNSFLNQDNQNSITVFTYGFQPADLYQRFKIAKKYHFKVISFGNCNIEQINIDSINKHNTISYKKLDSINGENWLEKYELDIQKTYSRDTNILNQLKAFPIILKKYSQYEILWSWVDSVSEKNIAVVNYFGYTDKNEFAIVFRAYFDITKMRLKKIESKSILLNYSKFISEK